MFNNLHIPDHVNIGYTCVPVEKYIPLPFSALNVNDLDITFLSENHNILPVQNVVNLMIQKIVLLKLLSNVQTAVMSIQLTLRAAQSGKMNKMLIQ